MTLPRRLGSLPAVAGAALALFAAAGPAGAQAPVQPGGIATVVATASVPGAPDSVRFRLDPAQDVRVFGRRAGAAAVDGGGVGIPITFGLPPSAAAGAFPLGRLHLAWPGGADSVDVSVQVAARRGATFWVGAESVTATAATPLEVGYRLRNRGNAADSFRVTVEAPAGWTAHTAPGDLVVSAGDTAAGTIRLVPPRDAVAGEEHRVRVGLTGTDVRESRGFRVTVVGEEGWLGGVAHVPGTLFVGSSSGSDGLPGVALQATGDVRPGARVSLALRHSDALDIAPAFRGRLAGPRIRLGIETPGWGLRLGDIFTPAEMLTGSVAQGRGGELEVRRENVTAALLVAAPLSYALDGQSGLMLRGAASVATEAGRFGLKAASVRTGSALFGPLGRAGASATWELDRAGHELSVEAGVLALSADTARAAGFAAQARYLFSFDGGSLTARLRKVPGATRAAASQGDEAFLSGSVRVSSRASLVGWSFLSAAPFADGGPYAAARGGALGVRAALPRNVRAELLGSYRENRVVGDTLPDRITRAVRASLDVPAGPLTLEVDAELGTASFGATRPHRQLRTGARWAGDRQWAWLGLYHNDAGLGAAVTGLDLAGALRLPAVDVQGGLNVRFPGAAAPGAVSLWSGASLPLTRQVSLTLGADHRPNDPAAPWRFSLGASRAFGLPLPIARQPVLHGVVFEDLDADHVRDPDEPALQGVRLHLGPLRTTTDEKGEFRFHDRARGELRVDPAALSAAYVVPAEMHLPTTGRVEIPVIRTATLEVEVFLDRDGDGERDTIEQLAAGAVVSLTDRAGRTRDAAADAAGHVRFGAVPPGSYTLHVYPPGAERGPAQPIEILLTLAPGSTTTRTVALPLRRREIRIRDGSAGS